MCGSYFFYGINQCLVFRKLCNSFWNTVSPVEFSYTARNIYPLVFRVLVIIRRRKMKQILNRVNAERAFRSGNRSKHKIRRSFVKSLWTNVRAFWSRKIL